MLRAPATARRTVAAALVLATSSVLLTAQPGHADDRVVVPDSATVTIQGRGFGHGHGMSQYGAAGAARQGLTQQQILAFYYPGTTVGAAAGSVSVLISADTTSDVKVRARSGLSLRRLSDRRLFRLPARRASTWRLTGTSDGRTVVSRRTGGAWIPWRTWRGEAEFSAQGAPLTLVLPGGRTARYRGTLRSAMPTPGSKPRDTVNVLSLEKYLRGVVPAEMPASWHPQAVQAQAVAARTYAAFERLSPRARHHQLCDTSSCQVYRGVDGEHPLATAAIKATRGQAVLFGGLPAFTQFSASSGGWSSAGSRPYLRAQADPYDGWTGNGVHSWQVQLPDTRLEQAWPSVGNLTGVQVLARDGQGEWGGRVASVRITGSTGTLTVSGDAFRFALGLRSTYLSVSAAPR